MKHISSDLLKNTSLYRIINYIEKRFPNIKIYGKCEQETTTGKNKIGLTNNTYTSNNKNVIVKNGILHFEGDSGSSNLQFYIPLVQSSELKANKTYTFSVKANANDTIRNYNIAVRLLKNNIATDSNSFGNTFGTIISNQSTITATPTEDTAYNYIFIQINANLTDYSFDLHWQVEEGNTVTDYEKYTGGIPAPNINYPMEVETKVVGNLEICKIETYKDYVYKTNGNWFKHKEIGKIDSYDGETIETDYMSTTGGLDTGAMVYYVLTEPVEEKITDITTINALEEIYSTKIRENEEEIIVDEDIN